MARRFGGYQDRADQARKMAVVGIFLVLITSAFALIFLNASAKGVGSTASVIVERDNTPERMSSVLVPRQRIERGIPLEPSLFQQQSRPDREIPARSLSRFEDIRGYYSNAPMTEGQILTTDLITSVRPANPISGRIPEGYRAVTISVNSTSSVEGWATPGARVDVSWLSNVRGKPGVSTIIQNAEVLSAERMTENEVRPGAQVPSTVTLLVTADDANKVILATSTGALSLSLRGDIDNGHAVGGGTMTIETMIGGADRQNARAASASVLVRERDGTQRELTLIEGQLVSERN